MGGAPNEGGPGLVAEADDDGGGGEDIHWVLHRVFTEAPGVPAPHKPQPLATTGCFTEAGLRHHGSLHHTSTQSTAFRHHQGASQRRDSGTTGPCTTHALTNHSL